MGPCKKRALVCGGVLLAVLVGTAAWLHMPGAAHAGPLPALSGDEQRVKASLRASVERLAGTIGERHMFKPAPLKQSADWIASELEKDGYTVERQAYPAREVTLENLVVEKRGTTHPDETLVIGAHYDSVFHAPGANDNGSGVAAMLAIAHAYRNLAPERTIRFVAFANEELGFQTDEMGSLVYARRCRDRKEAIVGMLSLETMGYYTDEPNSQEFPASFLRWFYPTTGNYVAFIGNLGSRPLVARTVDGFKRRTPFPAQGTALPDSIPGVGWSDQWAFWLMGYPALMVTDTAPFRYTHYHTPKDTPDKLNYDAFARVVVGLTGVVHDLAGPAR